MIEAAILDIDGTLVLSNDAHANAWVEAFAESGYDVSFQKVRGLIGMGGDKLLPTIVPGLNSEEGNGKRLSDRRSQIFAERYAPGLKPSPGSRAFVQHLREVGMRLIVASSAKREELDMLLKAAQVEDLITETTTSSDAEQSKPAPDIVQVALDKVGISAELSLMIGDTPFDV